MTEPIYAIPDIHGQDAALEEALDRVARDGGADARLVCLGDLVDRGPDSRAVVERLMRGQAAGRPWVVLRGNHDQMFVDYLDHGRVRAPHIEAELHWPGARVGGAATLASYGVPEAGWLTPRARHLEAARAAVPQTHRDWLAARPLWHEAGGLLFVHAGIRPGLPLAAQDPQDLMWIRKGFLDHDDPHPWLVVHGHTALDFPQYFGNRVDLDGGAGHGRPLWPAVFEGQSGWLLSEKGRIPLCP